MSLLSKYGVLLLACLCFQSPLLAQEETKETESAKQDTKQEAVQSDDAKKADAPPADAKQEPKDEGGEAETKDEAETKEAVVNPDLDTAFAALMKRYADINQKLVKVKSDFDAAAPGKESTDFREQYVRLVDEANLLVEEIRVTGTALLEETAEPDKELLSTMTGLVINDAFFDRDDSALTLGQKLIDKGAESVYFERAAEADRLRPSGKEILRELVLRSNEAAADDLPRVKLTTSKGDIVLELFENDAPETVGNFISLVKDGYYDGLTFHRVLDGFMAQGGCPTGDGTGGPGYNIRCECYKPEYRRHFTGSLSMAKGRARNTGGSQFFLTFVRTDELDGKHTVFGRVVDGMDIVNSIQRFDASVSNDALTPDVIKKAEVLRDRGHEYKPTKFGE